MCAGGARQRQRLRGTLISAYALLEGLPYGNPAASDDGVPNLLPAFEPTYTPPGLWMMIGRMIGAFGADDVAPAKVQKTTFSDDRRQ